MSVTAEIASFVNRHCWAGFLDLLKMFKLSSILCIVWYAPYWHPHKLLRDYIFSKLHIFVFIEKSQMSQVSKLPTDCVFSMHALHSHVPQAKYWIYLSKCNHLVSTIHSLCICWECSDYPTSLYIFWIYSYMGFPNYLQVPNSVPSTSSHMPLNWRAEGCADRWM